MYRKMHHPEEMEQHTHIRVDQTALFTMWEQDQGHR